MKIQDITTKDSQVSDQYSQIANNMKTGEQQLSKPVEQTHDGTQQPNQEDLLSKVTKFVTDKTPENKSDDDIDIDVFNDAEFRQKIDSIQDPELKQYMLSMRKTGVRGIQSRLQEISEMRKELTELKNGINPGWTPDRIQQLLNDKEFLNAAQSVLGNNPNEQNFSGDEDEYVPESVKREIQRLKQENNEIKQQWTKFNQGQSQAQVEQEHNRLKEKYGNYDPLKVNELISGLKAGKVQAGPEVVYKAYYHDENVKRAYEMGKRDASGDIPEKQNVSSFSSNSYQQPNSEIKPEKNETNKQFFNRIIKNKLLQLRK